MNQVVRIIKVSVLLLSMVLSMTCFSQQLEFMGLPIHSSISEYTKVLSSHRFKDEHTAGSLSHQYWEGGDFWKQKNCSVRLFAKDDIHVDIIELLIPYSNFKNAGEYIDSIDELLSDLSTKYGEFTLDTLDIEKETDIFFYPTDHQNDVYCIYTWSLSNGELKVMINLDYVYTISMQYKSIEYINWRRESLKFKGQGSLDL